MGLLEWALLQYECCPFKKRKCGHTERQITDACIHREMATQAHREQTAIRRPRREASEGTGPADTLVSDFQSQNYEEIKFCV